MLYSSYQDNPRINSSLIYDPGVHSSSGFMLSVLINCDVRGLICTLNCSEPVSVFPQGRKGKVIRTEETEPSCTGQIKQWPELKYIKSIVCFVLLLFRLFIHHTWMNIQCIHFINVDQVYIQLEI